MNRILSLAAVFIIALSSVAFAAQHTSAPKKLTASALESRTHGPWTDISWRGVCNGIATNRSAQRATCHLISAHCGDMASVDPTLLRGREVSHLDPTIFARDHTEFGVLSNHADSSC
jgi:hypothetical protein